MKRSVLAVAIVAVAIIGIAGVAVSARAQSSPPTRFFGTLRIDGAAAAPLTDVVVEMNGMVCSIQKSVSFSAPIEYVVDAEASSTIAGCGNEGQTVFFKVGNRYANETGIFSSGSFIRLDLTVTGAGTRPADPQGTATATATAPTPTPTPATATPTPIVTPTPPPNFQMSVVDLGSPCIPDTGSVCSTERQGLWTGDEALWAARGVTDPDARFVAVFEYRILAGDPAAIGAVAKGLSWPHVRIVGAKYAGGGINDEWVEVRNMGGADQDMTGWSVRVDGTEESWNFQDGFVLAPDQSCRFYTGDAGANACPGSSNIATEGVLNDTAGSISLWVDWLDLLAVRVTYSGDPNRQPAPPNLQGIR